MTTQLQIFIPSHFFTTNQQEKLRCPTDPSQGLIKDAVFSLSSFPFLSTSVCEGKTFVLLCNYPFFATLGGNYGAFLYSTLLIWLKNVFTENKM